MYWYGMLGLGTVVQWWCTVRISSVLTGQRKIVKRVKKGIYINRPGMSGDCAWFWLAVPVLNGSWSVWQNRSKNVFLYLVPTHCIYLNKDLCNWFQNSLPMSCLIFQMLVFLFSFSLGVLLEVSFVAYDTVWGPSHQQACNAWKNQCEVTYLGKVGSSKPACCSLCTSPS